ncbi:MAG: HEPN-associated N-terminal domain-containing protein [Methylobacter sp.]
MGREKNAMIEAEDRGWIKPEGYVCPDCVVDEYLKGVIRDYACRRECDYCGRRTRKHSASPVAEIMETISTTVLTWFNKPEDAGEFWDSEDDSYFSGDEAIDTREMLKSLLDCNEQLFEDIADAFINDEWVETANGHWLGSHPHELMTYAWEQFADIVKHESRYFFQQTPSSFANQEDENKSAQQENYNPANFLLTLGKLVNKLRLFDTLPTGKTLFRARPKEEGKPFPLNAKELGAPPSKYSRTGRMNPAGISYLYLAFEQETALAEVRQGNQSLQIAIGQFETQRELQILDLTVLPEKPSIFDAQHYEELVGLFFIDEFINEITKSVIRDGREHIEYVPSQVVSEYFALVFHLEDGKRLDGIKYPSSVRSGSHNLVLFPTERSFEPVFEQVEFQNGWDYPN